ncbi:hypothetical protein KTO58_21180 [Chitinophaga pendula]|uniref:RHS repeat domain-containing protein n=1 Tax=Chitinophaga TaxID=79328 RepID=UPI000BAEFD13|nr:MULTISPECIES: RHS repeat-associated core domain-containing protein [Chitinophaga]ASZ10855.1 hypothetical protein CK934_07625 [Chitinophaga sp. MD30]UCJ06163.1 hypothetical protein KTO58_21180 [Chitinophaga pendula]
MDRRNALGKRYLYGGFFDYPFGMLQPGRTYVLGGGGGYRYGFNGKENDNEVKGVGNQQDYGMRVYDPRVGKFLSVDPITKQYPELTPYQFASNSPIMGIDLDGLELLPVNSSMYRMAFVGSKSKLGISDELHIVQTVVDNIPVALNDGAGDLKYTKGGPVGSDGKDYKGAIIYSPGRYYNSGPDFNGKYGDEGREDPGEARKNDFGRLGVRPIKSSNYRTRNNIATGGGIIDQISKLKGLVDNQLNVPEWNASALEQAQRRTFYQATNLINSYIKDGMFVRLDQTFRTGQGKADLINFINDGTIPLTGNWAQGLGSSQVRSMSEYSLTVMHVGIQILKDQGIPLKESVSKSFSNLKDIYQRNGGEKKY